MNYKQISTKQELPKAENISDSCAKYYIIKLKHFGEHKAMYLKNEYGECNWYFNYFSKIIDEVEYWLKTV